MADRNTPGLGLARPTQQMACSSPQYSTGTSPLCARPEAVPRLLLRGLRGTRPAGARQACQRSTRGSAPPAMRQQTHGLS
jgi:hypothetical protein